MLPLIQLYPIIMKSLLLTIFLLLILNLKSIVKPFKTIKIKIWILLLLLFFCGLSLRLFVIPHTHQVIDDEFSHINIAENILYSDKFCYCRFGSNQECVSCFLQPWPPGYHTFLSLVFNLFGDSEQVAFNTNAIIGSVSIILIFILIYLLFRNSSLALLGAFIFNFTPAHLKYSVGASLEIFSVFFVLECLIFLEIYIQSKKFPIFLLFLSSLLYAIQIRTENLLLIFILSFYLIIRLGKQINILFNEKYLVSISIFMIMLIPPIQLIDYGINVFHSLGWNDSLWTKIVYLKNYFYPNIVFFVDYNYNSVILPVLCLLGCIKIYFEDRRLLFYLVIFFMLFFLMYSSYHVGDMNSVDSARYSLILYIPLIIISIKGIEVIIQRIFVKRWILIFLILLIFLISLFPTKNFIFSQHPLLREYEFILSMKDKLPSDIYIVSCNPAMIISSIHKKSIQISYFIENWNSLQFKNNVILFKDHSWYKIPECNKIEDELKNHYSFQLIERFSDYGFYNLTLR